jgi:hypothetical protein
LISYTERFEHALPLTRDYETAWSWFKKTQTSRSMKAIYGTVQRAGLVRVRNGSPSVTWYLESFEALFDPASRFSAREIWNALADVQYHGSMGNGRQLRELTRPAFIGIMQSLDLLAAARNEGPLPNQTDCAGNPLDGYNDHEELVAEVEAVVTMVESVEDVNFNPGAPHPGTLCERDISNEQSNNQV